MDELYNTNADISVLYVTGIKNINKDSMISVNRQLGEMIKKYRKLKEIVDEDFFIGVEKKRLLNKGGYKNELCR